MAHSPGPWRVDERASDHADHGIVVDRDGLQVCWVHQDDGLYGGGPNARLVAAAPEMLALLREVAKAHWEGFQGEGLPQSLVERIEALIARLEA